MDTTTSTRVEKGVSLARGPALVLGTVLQVAGLYFLYKQHGFPKLSNFPNGNAPVQGKVFLGIFGVNGWTGLFTAAAGGLLLFGAAQHLLAKTMSLVVGVALGAAAIIAVISGNVLGLAAANSWTKIGWAGCALILLFNTIVPRRRRTVADPEAAGSRQPATERNFVRPAPAVRDERPVGSEPVLRQTPVVRDQRPARSEPAVRDGAGFSDDSTVSSDDPTVSDTGAGALSDTGTEAVSDTGTEAVSDTRTEAVSDTRTGAVSDTGTGAVSDTEPGEPLDGGSSAEAVRGQRLDEHANRLP